MTPSARDTARASALLLALLASPAAAQTGADAAPAPATLYFHVFDTFNKFPINTQPMDVAFFEVGGTSFPTLASQGYDFNTIYGYATSGPVEYDFIENGRPRFHPERGIARDVVLDKTFEPVARVYFDVRDVFAGNALPMALPAFTVRVVVRAGNDVSDETKLDAGEILLEGRRTIHLADATACAPENAGCASQGNGALASMTTPDGTPILVPDADGIVEIALPLALQKDVIRRADAFNVRIDWWQDPGNAAGDDQFATGYVRLAADAKHLPRLEIALHDPLQIEFVHPQVAAGTLLVHAGVLSPWGTYDVDVENVTIAIEGPAAPRALERVVAQNARGHHLHDRAAEITWLWQFREEEAPSGEYRITVRATNLQKTALVESVAGFRIEGRKAFGLTGDGDVVQPLEEPPAAKDIPPAGALAALVAAAGAARLLSRRQAR